MPRQNQPPRWAMEAAKDYFDSPEIPQSEILELADRVAAFDEPEDGLSKIADLARQMRSEKNG